MIGFQKAFNEKMKEYFLESIPYNLFREAWLEYASNLVFQAEDFCCHRCGPDPRIVLFDATLLACRQDLLNISIPQEETPIETTGSKHSQRVLLSKREDQGLLRQFSYSTWEKPIQKEVPFLNAPESLKALLENVGIPVQVCSFFL